MRYEKLVIGTGASPVTPHIDGLNLPGVFPLHTMRDSFAIHDFIESAKPRRAVIVGAGYIGLEMADALTHRGIEVTIASRTPSVLPTVEPTFRRGRCQGIATTSSTCIHKCRSTCHRDHRTPLACLGQRRLRTRLRNGSGCCRCQAKYPTGCGGGPHNRGERGAAGQSTDGNCDPGHLCGG